MKEIKSFKLTSLPSVLPADSLFYVRRTPSSPVEIYITSLTGVPYPIKDLSGIQNVVNTDGTITVISGTNTNIRISSATMALINGAVQSGGNISELINDVGYITAADLPDTKAEFNLQLTDGTFLFVGDITQYTDSDAQNAVISQAITNGVTDKSPSEDVVFDKLLLKQDVLTESNFGAFSNALATEDDIQDSDKLTFTDSSDSNKQKKTTWLNLKAKLSTVYNALFVPKTRTITINGTTQDLSSDRSFTVSGGGASPKYATLTSSQLATQDVDGFVAYANALSPNLVIASDEFYDFIVTDTGQIFKLYLSGVTIGLGQTAITSADVKDFGTPKRKDILLFSVTNVIVAPAENFRTANSTENVWGIGLTGVTLSGDALSSYGGNSHLAPYNCKIKEVIISFENNNGNTTNLQAIIHTHIPKIGTNPKVLLNVNNSVALNAHSVFNYTGISVANYQINKGNAIQFLIKNNNVANNTIRSLKCYVIIEEI